MQWKLEWGCSLLLPLSMRRRTTRRSGNIASFLVHGGCEDLVRWLEFYVADLFLAHAWIMVLVLQWCANDEGVATVLLLFLVRGGRRNGVEARCSSCGCYCRCSFSGVSGAVWTNGGGSVNHKDCSHLEATWLLEQVHRFASLLLWLLWRFKQVLQWLLFRGAVLVEDDG